MNINEVDIAKAKQEFPLIAPIIQGALNAWPDNIGIYVNKIEKEKNEEKLKQWFSFWAKIDIMGTACMFTKLVRTDEQGKQKIKNIILKESKKELGNIRNFYKLMAVLLYLNDFENAQRCYIYVKYIDVKKINEIETEDSLEKINMLVRQYVSNTEEFDKIFSEEDMTGRNIINRIMPDSENKKKVQEIENVLDYIIRNEKNKKILEEKGFNLEGFMHKDTTFDSDRVSIQKVIILLQELYNGIEENEELKEIKGQISIFINNLKKLKEEQEDRTKEFINEEIENLIAIRKNEIEERKNNIREQQKIIHNILYKNVIETKEAIHKKEISKVLLRRLYNEALRMEIDEEFIEPLREYVDEEVGNYFSIISLKNNFSLSYKINSLATAVAKKKYAFFSRCRNMFKRIENMQELDPVKLVNTKEILLKNLNRIIEGLDVDVRELKDARTKVNKQIQKLELIKDEKRTRNQDIKDVYIDILSMKMSRMAEILRAGINLEKFNVNVVRELLERSKYELIFQYIKIVQEISMYSTIRNSLRNFNLYLAPKRANKDIIIEITNNFLKKGNANLALEFLHNIGVSKFKEYLPDDKCLLDYIEEIKGKNRSLQLLYIQKMLFFEYYQDTYTEEIVCTQKWLEYFENSRQLEIPEMVHEEIVILELLEKDIKSLDSDFVKEKIKQIEQWHSQNIIFMKKYYIQAKVIRVLNIILSQKTDIKTKYETIKKLSFLNTFNYQEGKMKADLIFMRFQFGSLRVKSNEIFKEVLSNITKDDDVENLIDIYMNTHIKLSFAIEDLLEVLSHKHLKGVFDSINKYKIYGKIKGRQNLTFYIFQIQNMLNNEGIRVERKNFEYDSNASSIYLAKIDNYNSLYNRIILKNIEIYKTRKNAIRRIDEEITKKTIDKLKIDAQNEYKYIHYDNIKNYIYEDKKREITNMKSLKQKIEEKEKYYDKTKQNYINALENNEIELKDIIYYYMNTASKYIINLDEFINMIANIKFPEKQIVNLTAEFKDYAILFNNLSDENKIVEPLQVESDNIEYAGNELRKYFMSEIKYQGGLIDTYDKKTGKIYIKKLIDVDIQKNSEKYYEVEEIFTSFVTSRDFEVLKKLKDLDILPELINEENKKYATERNLLYNYRVLFYNIFSILINDLNKLKLFLQYLGRNNYWRHQINKQTSVLWIAKQNEIAEDIKQLFIEKARTEDIETVLYCYFNTHIKSIINLDELLRNMARYNPELQDVKNEEGIVDLQKYNIKIIAKINKQRTNKDYTLAFINDINENLRIKLPPNTKLEFLNNLNVLKYDSLKGCIICEKNTIPIIELVSQYNRRMIYVLNEILKQSPKIQDLYELIEDETVKNINIYYQEFLDSRYFYDLTYKELKQLKNLNKIFKAYLEEKIEKRAITIVNIINVMDIYSNTIIRYGMQLDDFFEIIGPIIEGMEDLIIQKYKIKISKKISETKYEVYFMRYNRKLTVEFNRSSNNNLNLTEGKEYIANLYCYDIENRCIVLEKPEKIITYTNTTFFRIILRNKIRQVTNSNSNLDEFYKEFLEIEKLNIKQEEEFKALIDNFKSEIKTANKKEIKNAKIAIVNYILYCNDKVVNEKGLVKNIQDFINETKKWKIASSLTDSLETLILNGKYNININEDKNAKELLLEAASNIILKKEEFLRKYNF